VSCFNIHIAAFVYSGFFHLESGPRPARTLFADLALSSTSPIDLQGLSSYLTFFPLALPVIVWKGVKRRSQEVFFRPGNASVDNQRWVLQTAFRILPAGTYGRAATLRGWFFPTAKPPQRFPRRSICWTSAPHNARIQPEYVRSFRSLPLSSRLVCLVNCSIRTPGSKREKLLGPGDRFRHDTIPGATGKQRKQVLERQTPNAFGRIRDDYQPFNERERCVKNPPVIESCHLIAHLNQQCTDQSPPLI